ncbi:glutamic-type intramembrane protease PrsW [Virgibacillus sp. DJP39]|uniref:glutamic-type intramembrane protease PrsW n=1 Tax=Virgibacillus sp. DJP39 TaxID=3409790 RepID=UPI003BB66B7A
MLAILSAGVAPALALMSFFYLKDRFTEPLHLIVRNFIYGAILVFPIMFMQYALQSEGIGNGDIIQSFFVIALMEEFFKWFVFIYIIYHHTAFDAHYDGIVYAVAISLGFATVENFLFLLSNGIEYAFSRALFPVSSHALFGVIMGFYFGKAKIEIKKKKANISLALVVPFLLHGVYNFILIKVTSDWLLLLIPFMIFLWAVALRRVKVANATLPTKISNS